MLKNILRWPYWMEIVRLLTFGIVTFLMIFALVAYDHQIANQQRLIKQTAQNTTIIKNQQNTIIRLSKQLKDETNSIHDQASCIFLFFSQPQIDRNHTAVTYPPACVISSNDAASSGESIDFSNNRPNNTPHQTSSNQPKAKTGSQSPAKQPSPQPSPQPGPTQPLNDLLNVIMKAL